MNTLCYETTILPLHLPASSFFPQHAKEWVQCSYFHTTEKKSFSTRVFCKNHKSSYMFALSVHTKGDRKQKNFQKYYNTQNHRMVERGEIHSLVSPVRWLWVPSIVPRVLRFTWPAEPTAEHSELHMGKNHCLPPPFVFIFKIMPNCLKITLRTVC